MALKEQLVLNRSDHPPSTDVLTAPPGSSFYAVIGWLHSARRDPILPPPATHLLGPAIRPGFDPPTTADT